MKWIGWAVALSLAPAALAQPADWSRIAWDRVELKDGRVLEGSVEVAPDGSLRVRAGLGAARVARAEVSRLERGHDPLDELARLEASGFLDGSLERARAYVSFCDAFDLLRQARGPAQRLLDADPDDALARRVLGFVRREGAWVRGSEAWGQVLAARDAARQAARDAARRARRARAGATGGWTPPRRSAPRASGSATAVAAAQVHVQVQTVVVAGASSRGCSPRTRPRTRTRVRRRRGTVARERERGPRQIHVRPLDEGLLKRVKLDLK